MKNLILGIIALGVLGACNSEPKDEVGRYELRNYENERSRYSIFDTKTGKIVEFRKSDGLKIVTEIELNGVKKITSYNDVDTTYTIKTITLPYEMYSIKLPVESVAPIPAVAPDTSAVE